MKTSAVRIQIAALSHACAISMWLFLLPTATFGGALLNQYFPMSNGLTHSYRGVINSTTYNETELFSQTSYNGSSYALIYSGDISPGTVYLGYSGDTLMLYGESMSGISLAFNNPLSLMNDQTLANGGTLNGATTAVVYGTTVYITLSATVSPAGTVTVPAGTFSNCKQLTINVQASANGQSAGASAMVWVLAPNVGIIRDGVCSYNGASVQVLGYLDLLSLPGSLQVTLSPSAAVTAGAQWQVDGGAWQTSGAAVWGLNAGVHTIHFSTVSGYITPGDQSVTVSDGQSTIINAVYASKAQMISPTPGSTLTGGTTTFAWSSGSAVTQYALWVGSTTGTYDLYAKNEGSSLSDAVTLPTNGRALYVRLWSLISGAWQYNDYTYTAASLAQMIGPLPGNTLTNATTTFTWNNGTNVTQYALWVGSAAGTYDITALAVGTNLSQALVLPVDGRGLYVRLYSLNNGAWQWNDYTYSAYAAPPAKAWMLNPVNGSTNNSASVTFNWSAGTNVSQYALWVGCTSNSYDLCALSVGTNLSRAVTLPVDGRSLWVRLWSLIYGTWQWNDYSYRAFNTVKSRFTGLSNGATLGGTNVTLNWDAGAGATQYALWVGNAAGTYDLYAANVSTNLSGLLTGLPADGRRLYVRLWSLINGAWKQNDYEFNAFTDPGTLAAQMTTPTNGTVLVSSPATFNWSSGVGATQYALWLGSTPGDYDLTALAVGTNRTQALAVPQDGGAVYVRLWSWIGGAWRWNDYAYGTGLGGAAVKAQMTSHANGAVLDGAATTFGWNAGSGVSMYALWVGTMPGSYDLYAAALGSNRTQTVTGLPVDGGPVYVRLWSLIGGAWKFNDYLYSAALAP